MIVIRAHAGECAVAVRSGCGGGGGCGAVEEGGEGGGGGMVGGVVVIGGGGAAVWGEREGGCFEGGV